MISLTIIQTNLFSNQNQGNLIQISELENLDAYIYKNLDLHTNELNFKSINSLKISHNAITQLSVDFYDDNNNTYQLELNDDGLTVMKTGTIITSSNPKVRLNQMINGFEYINNLDRDLRIISTWDTYNNYSNVENAEQYIYENSAYTLIDGNFTLEKSGYIRYDVYTSINDETVGLETYYYPAQ
jgi:hypothetical protein